MAVLYNGYFVPIDAVTTDCPPLTTIVATATQAPPPPMTSAAAQSWGDAPAKIAVKPAVHKITDIEVFSSLSTTTPKPKLESLDDDKQQSNINIEIHNVFSFGTANNSFPPQFNKTDSKIYIPTDKNSESPVIFV